MHRVLAVTALALAISLPAAHAGDFGGNQSELIRSLLPTVVNITVRKEVTDTAGSVNAGASTGQDPDNSRTFVGSGFVIDPSGAIVTNYHVVEGAFDIAVTLSDGSVLPGSMMYASRLADLAVLRVQPDHPLTPVEWGDSTTLHVGDPVFAIGNPLGIGTSVSAGIISGLNRNVQDSPYDDYIQTDAAINHGNSGGPLFNMDGRVVGVDTALVSPTEASAGLGLAIPADTARFVIERLKTYGWVRPGWIGVKVQQVTPAMAEAMAMREPEGSVVSWVLPDGPARKAGIEIGDVILRYGDTTPHDERALLRDIVRTSAGETVPITLLRDGVRQTVAVTVAPWPRKRWETLDAPLPTDRPTVTIRPDLGLSLVAIAAGDRAKYGLEDGLSGALVSGVVPGSDAARRGMAEGDVILRVQGRSVAVPADVQASINAERAAKRQFIMILVLQKTRKTPGPTWLALRLPEASG
jgi:serine protease Do